MITFGTYPNPFNSLRKNFVAAFLSLRQFSLDNLRDRYLLPEEEPRLKAALSGPRAHMKPAVIVALRTGMCVREQLRMKRHQIEFLRDIVAVRSVKNGRRVDIPMIDDVREALAELCR